MQFIHITNIIDTVAAAAPAPSHLTAADRMRPNALAQTALRCGSANSIVSIELCVVVLKAACGVVALVSGVWMQTCDV